MMSRCLSILSAVLIAGALSCSGGEPASEPDAGGRRNRPHLAPPLHLRLRASPRRRSGAVLADHGRGVDPRALGPLLPHRARRGQPPVGRRPLGRPRRPDATAQSSGSVATVTTTLRAQLAELGYEPADVTYLALSHLHYDHAGNANDFAASTWLVQRAEHEAAFSEDPAAYSFDPQYYGALETAETLILDGDHDVFATAPSSSSRAPGHTPGHQVLFVDLAEYGPVVPQRRPLPLPGEPVAEAGPHVQLRRGDDPGVDGPRRGLPDRDRRPAVDRARHRRERAARQVAGVLRVGPVSPITVR